MNKCKWLAEFEGVCTNGDCRWVADSPPSYCKCETQDDCKYFEKEHLKYEE